VEAVTSSLEFGVQLTIVIDLAVESDPDGTVFIGYRLVTADEVDNRKSPMSETQTAGAAMIFAAAVRAAVRHAVRHPCQHCSIHRLA
jgi:hypothetical protein